MWRVTKRDNLHTLWLFEFEPTLYTNLHFYIFVNFWSIKSLNLSLRGVRLVDYRYSCYVTRGYMVHFTVCTSLRE